MVESAPSRLHFELPALPEALRGATAEQIYQHGFDAERAERFSQAAASFEEVRRQQPNNPYVLLDLARVYFQLLEIERARAVLQEASERAHDYSDLWYQIGLAYQDARLDHEAEECFQEAIRHSGGNLAYSAALIGYYESRGHLTKAQAELDRLSAAEVSQPLLAALRGAVQVRAGEHAAAIPTLTSAIERLPDGHSFQVNLRYALARALAASGQEAASLTYLAQAKARQEAQAEAPQCRQVYAQRVRVMRQVNEQLEYSDIRSAWMAEAEPTRQPLVFLLGYPRSGTTLLEQVIEAHTQVHGLEETGAIFQATRNLYDRPLRPEESAWERVNNAEAGARQLAREWYFEYLYRLGAPRDAGKTLLDKNPGLSGQACMIARLFPQAKILFAVRDPRDICLSAYQTHVTLTPQSVNWLRWDDTVRDCVRTLEQWIAVRERLPNAYLEVRYEDLISDLPQTGRRVMEFLGLDWEPHQEQFAEHARRKPVYSPTLYDVRQGLTPRACGKWRRFGLDYSAGEPGLTALLQQFGYEASAENSVSPRVSASATRDGGGITHLKM